uniref:Uncharacterized protein n=1 Tax=Micrurus corallinus TaxID=54390 RepID=A0A2D4GPX2_MICCO
MPAVFLLPHVVPAVYGQMVRQPAGPATPRDLALQPRALSYLPSPVLHFGRMLSAVTGRHRSEAENMQSSLQDPTFPQFPHPLPTFDALANAVVFPTLPVELFHEFGSRLTRGRA